ncbi:ribbon-helix-helix domain-containing protein [Meridianimarinicoccus sp. RP-17]|uniref:ribbon-helix-helix domain-containing protein n=1 Tax=Meridianimarinicoccus zhengii TaxID=2056810 RepID=UPI000DAE8DFB|nr:ribbon-helix-helix domain-containing protein [Phycocomes zhengii]
MTGSRPRKRSLTLRGHQTSVSLEDAFWIAFRDIAAAQDKAVNALAAEIDAKRGLDCGLASAIRVFVLNHFRQAAERGPEP